MNGVNSLSHSAAATAFDQISGSYDEVFTRSLIGRAQRRRVWNKLLAAFPPGSRLLELNCGTGVDARFLALKNRSVVACDASAAMIAIARQRSIAGTQTANLEYLQLANEELEFLRNGNVFDGAFSNFSGLNCLEDLSSVAAALAALVRPGGRLLICLWSRICFSELVWFLLHGETKKAVRRIWGKATARIGGIPISVSYPTVRRVGKVFSPSFQLKSHSAVGLFVPPSYVETWIRRYEGVLPKLEQMDGVFADWPVLRDMGDHVLLEFVRCTP
jgi:ubiquinone/menaquinone biosynthesis C-methylase UbiE